MKLINWRLAITAIFLFAVSCKKTETNLGLELQEDQLETNYDNSALIDAKTVRVDSLRSDGLIVGRNLLGSYSDPILGRTDASIYTQLNLSGITNDFDNIYEIDSTFLTLSYSGYNYGFGTFASFDVFEFEGALDSDSSYYSNQSFPLKATNFVEDPDFLYKMGEFNGNLNIRLNSDFGFLMSEGHENFGNSENFMDYFNGIHVSTTNNWGSIHGFDLGDSKITMYFKTVLANGDSIDTDYDFLFDNNTLRFEHYDHEYLFGFDEDTLIDDNNNYIQGGASLMTRVTFPDLLENHNSGEVFNKVELILPVDLTDESSYSKPETLLVFTKDDEGKLQPLQEVFGFDGNYYNSDNTYHLVLTRYIQQIVNGEIEDNGIYITTSRGTTSVDRAVIKTDEIKLRITHSE